MEQCKLTQKVVNCSERRRRTSRQQEEVNQWIRLPINQINSAVSLSEQTDYPTQLKNTFGILRVFFFFLVVIQLVIQCLPHLLLFEFRFFSPIAVSRCIHNQTDSHPLLSWQFSLWKNTGKYLPVFYLKKLNV